jgi:hypothetical protein
VPKKTSYESAFADAPHINVTVVVELRFCPSDGDVSENAPGGLQVIAWILNDCIDELNVPQVFFATTFQKYVTPACTLTCRLVPGWFPRNGGFGSVPK